MTRPGWWARADTPRARARAWTTRGAVNGCLVALVALATAASALFASGRSGEATAQAWGSQVPADLTAARVGCGPVQLVTNPSSVVGTVDIDGVLPYDTTPPVAGWFARTPAAASDMDATPEQVVAALWGGQRAVWVSADTPSAALDQVRAVVAAHPAWRAVVRRWPASRGDQMPAGSVAYATWGKVQTCAELDTQVADAFFGSAPPAPGASGAEPPVAFARAADRS